MPVDGFFAIAPVIFFVTFLILAGLGVACEYLAKIFRQTKNRPVYIIKESDEDLKNENRKD